jgi:lyso-ornithine lipid O-acyltransferase
VSVVWAGSDRADLPPLGLRDGARLVLRGAAVIGVTVFAFSLYLVLRGTDLVRRRLGLPVRPARAPFAVLLWARAALSLAGLAVEQRGQPMAHRGAVVANHSGWLDVLVLMRAVPVFFVSKAEVGEWPIVGTIGRAIGTVFIERRPAEAKRQGALIEARLHRGDRMALFPEGTSTDGMRVLRFKSSLFEAFLRPGLRDELWVQPVTIAYRPPHGLPTTFYAWWGGADFGPSLRDVLGRSRGGRVALVFHPPLCVADYPDRKALARAAEEIVRAELEARIAAVPATGQETE